MVDSAYQVFVDLDATALEGGYVYLGEAYGDPELTPVAVFWDEALTISAAQPLRTSGGYIINTGTPANIYTAATSYSVRVRTSAGSLVYYVGSSGQDLAAGRAVFPIAGGPAGPPGAAGNVTTSRALLKTIGILATAGNVWFLSEGGRSGNFVLKTGACPNDPLEGLFLAIAGNTKHWARVFDGPAFAEWFGAVANNPAVNSAPAFSAACALSAVVRAGAGTYYTTETINTGSASLIGSARGKTAFSCSSPTAHVIKAGGVRTVSYAERVTLSDFTVTRTVTPTTAANLAAHLSQGHGVHLDMTSNATISRVEAYNNLVDFYIANALSPLISDCLSIQQSGGVGALRHGYYVDALAPGGLSGFTTLVFRSYECRQSNQSGAETVYGFVYSGNATDSIISGLETAACNIGLWMSGGGGNVHIMSNWHDQCKNDGIRIDDTGYGSKMVVHDAYVTPNANGLTTSSIWLNNCHAIQITDCYLDASPGTADNVIGVKMSGCIACRVTGHIQNHGRSVLLDTSISCAIDVVGNKVGGAIGQAIVRTVGGSAHRIAAGTIGVSGSSGYTAGVDLTSGTANCHIDLTGVIASNVTNKLVIGGTPDTGAGNRSGHFVIRPGATFTA